ncbi:hypothetical protein U8V72_15385 [Priestia filamentosa]|uniref:hypothetical protein n=1 Tax=Priestia filamentosa TaxID=1402861 RepID=UPI0005892A73
MSFSVNLSYMREHDREFYTKWEEALIAAEKEEGTEKDESIPIYAIRQVLTADDFLEFFTELWNRSMPSDMKMKF